MDYLLDTHTLLWFLNGSEELSKNARKAIEDTSRTKYISIVSFWEIAVKVSLKKLDLDFPYNQLLEEAVENGFEILPLTFNHTIGILNLDFHHKDPFDRAIIAQSMDDKLRIISRDDKFKLYPVSLLW